MRSLGPWLGALSIAAVAAILLAFPEYAFAFGFESKVKGLTNQLINTVLPLLSVLGLVYAAILALSGDGAAKGRVITVIVMSIIGFLAPTIISWLQQASGF